MERLQTAATSAKVGKGSTAIADWLNESPQTINNWKSRGVSMAGALKAQAKSGFNATWILYGTGEQLASAPATADDEGEVLVLPEAAASLPPEYRQALANLEYLPKRKRAEVLRMIDEAANEAREYRDHFAGRDRAAATQPAATNTASDFPAMTEDEERRVAALRKGATVSTDSSSKRRS